jgi:aminopeptidase N
MRRLLVAFLLFSLPLSSAGLRADTYRRQPGIQAQHYVFHVTLLTTDTKSIDATASVRFRVVAGGVKEATLDLATPTPDGKGMTVTSVRRDGAAVAFRHDNNKLTLPLPVDAKAGQDVTFDIAYRGQPAFGLNMVDNIYGEATAFTDDWFNHARQWLPVIDHIASKATAEFVVTTKSEYQVISNGRLIETVDLPGGLRRTRWSQDVPVSPWLYSLGVARFVVRHDEPVKGVPMSYWAFPQDEQKGLAALERDARGAFEFFSEHVGPFAYVKLAHIEAAGMSGGTELATSIFYGEKSVSAGSAPVVHETAHQWFGDAVTENDWNDVWLSEGFATYFTLLYAEHAAGRDAFVDGLRRSRDTVFRVEKTLPDTPVVHVDFDESGQKGPNNQLVYQKGSWTLHMLRGLIGMDAFWRGIRLYYAAHLNGLASTADLRAAMEQASGQDLGWFFRQWLTRAGEPQIEGSWRYDAAAKKIVVTIRQTQTGEPFRFALDVGVAAAAGTPPRVQQVDVRGPETTVEIAAESEPASVVLDPNVWLLARWGAFDRQPAGGEEHHRGPGVQEAIGAR